MATNPIGPVKPDPNPYAHSGSAAIVNPPQSVNLATNQTPSGSGTSTHIADRGDYRGPAVLKFVSTIGATPSVTVTIEGSLDGSDWFGLGHAADDVAAPALGNLVITTAVTQRRFLPTGRPWRYLRLSYTSALNVTLTVDLMV